MTNKEIALELFGIFFPNSKIKNIQNYGDMWIDETIHTGVRVIRVNDDQVVVTITNRETREINTYLNIDKSEFELITKLFSNEPK